MSKGEMFWRIVCGVAVVGFLGSLGGWLAALWLDWDGVALLCFLSFVFFMATGPLVADMPKRIGKRV